MSSSATSWSCAPYSVAAADTLARELGLSPTLGQILARRGFTDVDAARRHLSADERHDPRLLGDMDAACALILEHVSAGGRIVVHGDYDVDGVCSTTVLVEALRTVGATPSWRLPSRAEGYGLSEATVSALAGEGTALLIAVDCGITAVAEVGAAHAAGVDVVVCDHHRPSTDGAGLPACPIVHPALGGYPFDGLCATAVAHKLSAALRARAGLDPSAADTELDLVALATVCDVVPLRGENRRLVSEGMRALARTTRPGVRALMRIAAVDPGRVDERALGFRLGPRLNAAGRLHRADAALELLMTRDEQRAREVADELDLTNRERRDVETRILFAAEAARTEQADAPAYVLSGEGWHPGVVGIVAARMTERHHRPCVVIAVDGDGARGSGRSIAAFDLHAAFAACAGHLRRFGGHRAAAGLELDRERIESFRAAFTARAAALLSPHDLTPVQEGDAFVSGGALGLPLAEELRLLAPFGHGNPEPTLLVPAARVANLRAMGEDGQHARFTLTSAGTRAEAVAFRASPSSLASAVEQPSDAAVRLELNDYNGAVEARAVLSALCPTEAGECRVLGEDEPFLAALARRLADDDSVAAAAAPAAPESAVAAAEAGGDSPQVTVAPAPATLPRASAARQLTERLVRDRRGEGIAGLAGELLASGEPVLVVCADVARRRASLERLVAGLSRGGSRPGGADAGSAKLAICSWDRLAADPSLARPHPHLLALDPPSSKRDLALARAVPVDAPPGFVHLGWGPSEVEFALAVARTGLDLRPALAELYRRLRAAGPQNGADLERLLAGDGPYPRPAGVCARMLRVLGELGLAAYEPLAEGGSCRALEAPRTMLERSPAYRLLQERLAESERFLAEHAAWFDRGRRVPGARTVASR